MVKSYVIERAEKRVPIEVAVHIYAHEQDSKAEETFTENVSSRGARVLTMRRWQPNDRLVLASRPGDFLATARVAYCQSLRGEGFAIGVEFLEPAGSWVVHPQPVRENR